MEENYNKIAGLFQFLHNDYVGRDYRFISFYKCYSMDDIDFPTDTLELIENLKKYSLSNFYTKEAIKAKGFSEDFYNSKLVKEIETQLEFHLELPKILFFYLLKNLVDTTNHFLEIINSQSFKDRFRFQFEMNQDFFKYSIHNHKEIYDYLDSHINKFELMNYHFNINRGTYSRNRFDVYYDIKTIKACLEELKNYNFNSHEAIEL